MKELILNNIRRKFTMLLFCIGISTFFVVLYIAIFPTLKAQQASLLEIMKNYPQTMFQAFNVDVNNFGSFDGYIATEIFSITWIVLLMVVILPAATSLCSEIDRSTIELIMSQPLTRTKLVLGKYIAGLINILLFVTLSILIIIPLTWIAGIESTPINYIYLLISAIPFAMVIYSGSFFLNTVFKEPSKVNMLTLLTILGFYVLRVIASVVKDLDKLKYLTIFHYFDPNKALVNGTMEIYGGIAFIAISAALLLASIFIFNRRDVI